MTARRHLCCNYVTLYARFMSPASWVLFVVLLCLLLASVVMVVGVQCKLQFKPRSIPKIIWTYWNSDDVPEFVHTCVGTWKRHHPDFDIRVLTPRMLPTVLDFDVKTVPWNDSPTRESDIVRMNVLQRFGGVWSDASILLTNRYPFVAEMERPHADFVGYYIDDFTTDERYPVIENWLFATAPRGVFITAWRDAFMDPTLGLSIDNRLNAMLSRGVDVQNIAYLQYLFMHVCAQFVLQKVLTPHQRQRVLRLTKAEDGPLKYLADNAWDSAAAVRDMASCFGSHGAVYKIRGLERPFLTGVMLQNLLSLDNLRT